MKESRLIKIQEVLRRCAMSRSTLYRLVEAKRFPLQVSVTGSRSVAWRDEEIQRWVEERPTINK